MVVAAATPGRVAEVAERVAGAAADYEPPGFHHVPSTDAALFLCAIDHKAGYRGNYLVGGKGPYRGSALLWELALRAGERRPGLLTAKGLAGVSVGEVAEMLRIGGETVAGPDVRARLWRDLAAGLEREYGGKAEALLAAAEGRLAGAGGLLARLAEFEAYADPLEKKSFLLAKVCERRGWLDVTDPEHWQVSADSVLMRLSLRSGLVHPGEPEQVREATRRVLHDVADAAGLSPPVLDDFLWELGREDPDLLGNDGGEVLEPPRPSGTVWY